jgi:D-glycero-alpha-D-manno-heptose-7-phosphate kinase
VDIAERACHLEAVEAGIPGGRQDQFASSHGGFLRLDFKDPDAEVKRLSVDPDFAEDLGRRMILCYTTATRFSGATINRVMQAYENGDPEVARALHGIRGVAESMVGALAAADAAQIGRLMSENWRHQLALDPHMQTGKMAELQEAVLAAGALGGKAAGSGAGGCMFFVAPDDPDPVIQAARRCGVTLLPVRWAMYGVRQC